MTKRPCIVLMADDDEDDFFLVQEAFRESGFDFPLTHLEDGKELIDYLYRLGRYSDPERSPRPDLIMLDLNMPKKSGREALNEIKGDFRLKDIPVVIITTSNDDRDKHLAAQLGVRSFVTKPDSFDELVVIFEENGREWLAACH